MGREFRPNRSEAQLERREADEFRALSHRNGGAGARCLPQLEIRLEVVHQGPELVEVKRLRAVAEGFFGKRMHFDEQAVRAHGHRRARQRRHQAALAGGVAGIEDDGQMG